MEGTAETFVVPLTVERPTSVVVFLIQEDGLAVGENGEPEQIAFPPASSWSTDTGRIQPGAMRVLPRAVIQLKEDAEGVERIEFSPGFLVPRRSRRLHVLVALRTEPLTAALRVHLQQALRQSAQEASVERLAALQKTLATSGFECLLGQVDER